MATNELNEKIQDIRELKRMVEELTNEINSLQDEIKEELNARGVDELAGVDWKVSYKTVMVNRLDTNAIKREFPEIIEEFTKSTVSHRFTLT